MTSRFLDLFSTFVIATTAIGGLASALVYLDKRFNMRELDWISYSVARSTYLSFIFDWLVNIERVLVDYLNSLSSTYASDERINAVVVVTISGKDFEPAFDGLRLRVYSLPKTENQGSLGDGTTEHTPDESDCGHENDTSSLRKGVVLWIHGGGWTLGSAQGDDFACKYLVSRSLHATIVVSVDYRLSPESPYPAPLDDCELALKWIGKYIKSTFNGDPHRLIIAGESSGGNLAAALLNRTLVRKIDDAPPTDIRALPTTHVATTTATTKTSSSIRAGDTYNSAQVFADPDSGDRKEPPEDPSRSVLVLGLCLVYPPLIFEDGANVTASTARHAVTTALRGATATATIGQPSESADYTSSYQKYHLTSGLLPASRMYWFWRNYVYGLPNQRESEVTPKKPTADSDWENKNSSSDSSNKRVQVGAMLEDIFLNPLLTPANILREYPPTIIFLAHNDVLVDEGLAFAAKIRHVCFAKEEKEEVEASRTSGVITSNDAKDLVPAKEVSGLGLGVGLGLDLNVGNVGVECAFDSGGEGNLRHRVTVSPRKFSSDNTMKANEKKKNAEDEKVKTEKKKARSGHEQQQKQQLPAVETIVYGSAIHGCFGRPAFPQGLHSLDRLVAFCDKALA